MTVLSRSLDLIRYGRNAWRIRSLRRAFREAQYALGERMVAAGIDDGQVGAQLATLEETIRRADSDKAVMMELVAERKRLYLLLAVAALEEDAPLPGAETEYEKAKEALAALLRNRDKEQWVPRTFFAAHSEPMVAGF